MSNWEDEISFGDELYTCPICGNMDCVPANGPKDSPILIIGAYPGKDEIKSGKPMSGQSGGILKAELRRAGVMLNQLRVCNLWLHEPSNKKDEHYEKCFNHSVEKVMEEAKGKKAILLIGSEPVRFLADSSVEAMNGLRVESDYLSAPLIMGCVQPTTAFHGGVGEFRLAIEKFANSVKDLL